MDNQKLKHFIKTASVAELHECLTFLQNNNGEPELINLILFIIEKSQKKIVVELADFITQLSGKPVSADELDSFLEETIENAKRIATSKVGVV